MKINRADNKNIQAIAFAAILFLLMIGMTLIFKPFFSILLWSTLLYVIFGPIFSKITAKLNLGTGRGRLFQNVAAGLFSVMVVLIIVTPLVFVFLELSRQITDLVKTALKVLNENQDFIIEQNKKLNNFLEHFNFGHIDISKFDLKRLSVEFITGSSNFIIHSTTAVIKNIGIFLLNLAFMIFILFFFFVDGSQIFSFFSSAIPIRSEYAVKLVQKFRDISRSLFMGFFLVAGYQALAAFIIFSIFKVQGALVFAILIFFSSFIPMFGAGGIWIPIGLLKIFSGDLASGLVMMMFCLFFVSLMDNVLRPLFLKDRIKLHPLIIFFAILGGVAAFGFNGLILGPLVVIFFFTVLDMFLDEHGVQKSERSIDLKSSDDDIEQE